VKKHNESLMGFRFLSETSIRVFFEHFTCEVEFDIDRGVVVLVVFRVLFENEIIEKQIKDGSCEDQYMFEIAFEARLNDLYKKYESYYELD
jgi:hypothetical protein